MSRLSQYRNIAIVTVVLTTTVLWCGCCNAENRAAELLSGKRSFGAIRQQVEQRNGVLISRPLAADEFTRDFLAAHGLNNVSGYVSWLGKCTRYNPDAQGDEWASPLETVARRGGDCEDFSFLNESVLQVLGLPAQAVMLGRLGRSHAICIFRYRQAYFILDNNRLIETQAVTARELVGFLFRRYRCASLWSLERATQTRKLLCRRQDDIVQADLFQRLER